MAFKSFKSFNEQRYKGLFMLKDDGDSADVVFLYQSYEDVMVCDVHYIKSSDYSGYVQCLGNGCPACSRSIRVQTKLFIPVYNIMADEIQFFDRNVRFEAQLSRDVFSKFPNPSEYVFRITRHGAANAVETTYEFRPIGRNSSISYSEILAKFNATMPEYYNTICKDVSPFELSNMLNSNNDSDGNVANAYVGNMPSYQISPRGISSAKTEPEIPPTSNSIDVTNIPEMEVDTTEEVDDVSF